MAKGRITVRRELRQPDGFMKTATMALGYVKGHRRSVIVGAVVLAISLAGVVGVSSYFNYQNRRASQVLTTGLQAYATAAGSSSQVQEMLAELKAGAENAPLAASYPLLCYLRGNGYYDLQDYDQARHAYEEALVKADGYVADLCRLGLAYVAFAEQAYAKSIEILEALQADKTSFREDVYLLMGMSFEQLNKVDDAVAAYENMIQFVPDSQLLPWVEGRLERLKLIGS
ncbi:MAG: tetratricopeptide repeat protein [Deltaproteobacteria bacterium]|nr:tetratricopeptide repeat protein [Candidatus Anaeroferrophillus wilburensis]MBN2889742.1 tetratricopeptide repeat protein [Deltaproteobacteria bacterium]